MARTFAVTLVLATLATPALAEPPLLPVKDANTDPNFSWIEVFRSLPPLKHERGDRWPMICWEAGGYEPLPPETHKMMLQRGFVQNIRMDVKMIPTAQAIQAAGGPVIMMNGAGGTWPYHLAGKRELWAHQFDPCYQLPARARVRPCPTVLTGYAKAGQLVRDTLQQYKDANVTVAAVWMDWEGDPLGGGREAYEQARHCARCRELIPAWVLTSRENYSDFCWRLYYELLGAYLAAPSREVFPKISSTNWAVVYSTPLAPVMSWRDTPRPHSMPSMLTATNPVAYGNTYCFVASWKREYTLDREHVDQFYTYLLLQQVSANAANAALYAPQVQAVPWVARWCPDVDLETTPIMSRPRYREVLRHLWLRGCEAMQVFNPRRKGYDTLVATEVQDAQAVYDEMLAFRELLDDGEVMNTDIPDRQSDQVVWSGLRLKDQAVVRVFKQGGGEAPIEIEPWPGQKVRLVAPAAGRTYLLRNAGKTIAVEPQ